MKLLILYPVHICYKKYSPPILLIFLSRWSCANYFNLANTYTYKFTPIKLEEAAFYIRNQLTPRGFEFFIAELFKELSHKAEVTPAEQDWGRYVEKY